MPAGRPLKYIRKEQIEPLIAQYFKYCDDNKRPYTISGLANALDMCRHTLIDYEGKGEFSHTIKRAKSICEQFAEECLFTNNSVAGVIFNLKNNYSNWNDKQEPDRDTEPMSLKVTFGD